MLETRGASRHSATRFLATRFLATRFLVSRFLAAFFLASLFVLTRAEAVFVEDACAFSGAFGAILPSAMTFPLPPRGALVRYANHGAHPRASVCRSTHPRVSFVTPREVTSVTLGSVGADHEPTERR